MSALNISFKEQSCFVSINNSSAGNSFGLDQANELIKLLNSKEFKKSKALIWITPEQGPFCSGGNLKYYAKLKSKQQGVATNRKITLALKKLSQIEQLTFAIVEGDCFGGGVELLSSFDFVIGSPKAMFGLWQRKISLTFGWGGGSRLEARLGAKRILQESLLARTFSAYEALEMNLIDMVLPKWKLQSQVQKIMKSHLQLPQTPIEKIKKWSVKNEQKIFESLWLNKEHQAILKKRK